METTNYFNILNIGTALPLVFRSNSELYMHKYGKHFIHKCGHTYYMYSLAEEPYEKTKYDYMSRGYKVKDVIHMLASFGAEKIYESDRTYSLKELYEINVCDYNMLKKFEDWNIDKFCDYIRHYFDKRKKPYEIDIYYGKYGFLKALKAIFFYNDAANALSRYRYGVFKIIKLPWSKEDEELDEYVLVAGGELNKCLFDNLEKMVCY